MRYTTRAKFVEWLRQKEPEAVVGESRYLSSCPLATHLEETWGSVAEVDISDMAVRGHPYVNTPQWAKDFIDKVDEYSAGESITAKVALELLGEKA